MSMGYLFLLLILIEPLEKWKKKLQKSFCSGKENHWPYENISFIVTSKYFVKHVFLIHSHISNLDPKLRLYLIHVEGIDQSHA